MMEYTKISPGTPLWISQFWGHAKKIGLFLSVIKSDIFFVYIHIKVML